MSLRAFDLDESATEEQLKAEYRKRAMAAHPDRGGSVEEFQQLKDLYDEAQKELQLGATLATARLQMDEIRSRLKGTKCPRCDGSGERMGRQVGFRRARFACPLCNGKGKLS